MAIPLVKEVTCLFVSVGIVLGKCALSAFLQASFVFLNKYIFSIRGRSVILFG